jgi:predicted phosphoribosyltransferase
VPSSDPQRDEAHPLRTIVGEIVEPTRTRYRRLLRRSGTPVPNRTVDPGKYNGTEDLAGQSVLLIDDTWTTGANVQSAAAALKTAGADSVGVLVIGRHIHADYQDNSQRLAALPQRFDWDACARHL